MAKDKQLDKELKGKMCDGCGHTLACNYIRGHKVCKKCFCLVQRDNQELFKKGIDIPESLELKSYVPDSFSNIINKAFISRWNC